MSNDLAIIKDQQCAGYCDSETIDNVFDLLPGAENAARVFHKSHSQFQYATIDNNCVTPIRAMVQVLAKINHTRRAIAEASFKVRKTKFRIERLTERMNAEASCIEKELISCELDRARYQNEEVLKTIAGAVRKLSALLTQHKSIGESIGDGAISEEDYERDEARFHIMTAMKQALIAARARGGVIDEGNQIYLFDIGINGAQAQAEVSAYLDMEAELLNRGMAPTHEMTVRWLEACADKWQHCPSEWAGRRGIKLLDHCSLLSSA